MGDEPEEGGKAAIVGAVKSGDEEVGENHQADNRQAYGGRPLSSWCERLFLAQSPDGYFETKHQLRVGCDEDG